MIGRGLAAGALALLGAVSAQAEGWTVLNFSSVNSRDICMNYAEATVDTYRARFGGDGFTGRSEWTIGGYDLRGEAVDALFVCGDEAGFVEPYLIVYNGDNDDNARETIADRLGDIWDEIVASGGTPTGGSGGGTK